MEDVEVAIVADSFEVPVAVAPDRTFTLERNARALKENASVRPNRKKQSLTWRAEIRTPGLPPGTRRLGDLRLECEVGMVAGLISNYRPSVIGYLANLFPEGADYCARTEPRYLFFADRPVWAVTLVSGARRETLPVDRMYAGASRDPDWKATSSTATARYSPIAPTSCRSAIRAGPTTRRLHCVEEATRASC
jgi:hypothetical protein